MSSPQPTLRAISSMATRQLLATLVAEHRRLGHAQWQIESVGGVDAAKRVAAGESFDLVLLASDAIDQLMAQGHLQAASRVDWVLSQVVVAVPEGAPAPDVSTESALRQAVMQAPTLGISTGPSGTFVEKMIRGWGLSELLEQRLVKPPPGTPVGQLMARGQVALGFQQRSEMVGLHGVKVLGPLPEPVSFTTVFSAGIPMAITPDHPHRLEVERFLSFLTSPSTSDFKLQHGMSALS